MLTKEERKQMDTLMGQVAKINYVLHNYKMEMWAGFADTNREAVNIRIYDRKPEYMQSFIEKPDVVYNLVSEYKANSLKDAVKMYPSKMLESIEKINEKLNDYSIDMCYGDELSHRNRIERILGSIASLEKELDMKIFNKKSKSMSSSLKPNTKKTIANNKNSSMEI